MALSYVVNPWETQVGAAGGDITYSSRTYNAGELVVVLWDGDITTANNLSIANSGTAQSWTLIASTAGTGGTEQVGAWRCVMSVTQAMTITVSGDSATTGDSGICSIAHSGAHLSNPVPAGNVFSGNGATDVSQSITPTSSGSCLWMLAGDFNSANTFAAGANCTLQQTASPGTFVATLVRPTTQPRPDAAAFTISETDSGTIAWIAFEVQANPSNLPTYDVDRPWLEDLLTSQGVSNSELRNAKAWF